MFIIWQPLSGLVGSFAVCSCFTLFKRARLALAIAAFVVSFFIFAVPGFRFLLIYCVMYDIVLIIE